MSFAPTTSVHPAADQVIYNYAKAVFPKVLLHIPWDCIPFDSIPGHVGVYVCNLSSTLRYSNGGCSSSTCTLDYAYIHMSR